MKENEIEAARNRITLAGRQAGLEDRAQGVYRLQDNPFKPPRNGPWTVTADQYAWLWADAYTPGRAVRPLRGRARPRRCRRSGAGRCPAG